MTIKKGLLIFASFILLSGCSVQYDITITNEEILEDTVINDVVSDNHTSSDIMSFYNSYYPVYYSDYDSLGYMADLSVKYDNIPYYTQSYSIDNNGYHLKYQYHHELERYCNNEFLVNSFDLYTCEYKDSLFTLKTENYNSLLDHLSLLDSITVHIKTDYNVLENNADDVTDNVYTWYLTKENNAEKRIHFQVDLSKTKEEAAQEEEQETVKQEQKNNNIYIILGIVFIYIIGLFLFIIKKK